MPCLSRPKTAPRLWRHLHCKYTRLLLYHGLIHPAHFAVCFNVFFKTCYLLSQWTNEWMNTPVSQLLRQPIGRPVSKKIDYSVWTQVLQEIQGKITEEMGFQTFPKTDIEDADSGRVFHSRKAETGKARSPMVERLVRWTTSDDVEAERRRWRVSTADVGWNSSARNGGAVWSRHLYISTSQLELDPLRHVQPMQLYKERRDTVVPRGRYQKPVPETTAFLGFNETKEVTQYRPCLSNLVYWQFGIKQMQTPRHDIHDIHRHAYIHSFMHSFLLDIRHNADEFTIKKYNKK